MEKLKKRLRKYFFPYGNNNISNVAVNHVATPFYFSLIYIILHYYYRVPNFGKDYLSGAVPLSTISSAVYMYCSAFFQPDLDHPENRPGKHTFPFPSSIKNFGFGQYLKTFASPINLLWNILWQPFANLLTHRGISHLPILGLWLRIWYLMGVVFLFEMILTPFGLKGVIPVVFKAWLASFFPWEKGFGSLGFYLLCFPIFISDIFHSLGDYIESYLKGTSYVSQTAKRGYLAVTWKRAREIPNMVKEHLDSLK